jgi:2-dehydropantoate 2-reductase
LSHTYAAPSPQVNHNQAVQKLTETRYETVAIVGLGSIGGVVAGLLNATGRYDLTACVRIPINHLTVEHLDEVIEKSIQSLTNMDDARPVDWVLLCTKVHDIPSVAQWLRNLCSSTTRIAVLQNGIGHVDRLTPYVNGAEIVPTIVYFNGERFAPNHMRIRHAGNYDLAVSNTKNGRDFAALLSGTPLSINLSDDFEVLSWRKLLINAIANPITALTMQRQAVFRREEIKTLCLAVLREAIAVGQASGVDLVPEDAERTLSALLTYSPELGTSMYFDRLANRPLEIEAITGAIVDLGVQHGIQTPINTTLLVLLRGVMNI